MITATVLPWTLVKCRFCGKPLAEVQGAFAIRARCRDRGCGMWNELVLDNIGSLRVQ